MGVQLPPPCPISLTPLTYVVVACRQGYGLKAKTNSQKSVDVKILVFDKVSFYIYLFFSDNRLIQRMVCTLQNVHVSDAGR